MRLNFINEVRKMAFKMPRDAAVTIRDERFTQAEVAQLIYDLCQVGETGWQKANAVIEALRDLEA